MSSKARLNADKQIVDKEYVEQILAIDVDPEVLKLQIAEAVADAVGDNQPITEINGGHF